MKKPQNTGKSEKAVDLKKIGAIIEKNYLVMSRDRIRFIPLLIFPIIMILVLGSVSGNSPKHIATAIVAYDESPASLEIQRQIASSETFSVGHVVSTEGEGKALLDSGEVRVLIEIPADLESDIATGTQSGIIVIVDESDSAIAATSKQVFSQIISNVASKISRERFLMYQTSVDAASKRLNDYISKQPNEYGLIASRISTTENSLKSSKGIIDQYTQSLILSVPPPVAVVLPINTITVYRNITTENPNTSTVFLDAPSVQQIRAQIQLLQQSSALIDSSMRDVHAAASASQDANALAVELQQEYYKQDVINSLDNIRVFTTSKYDSTFSPIIYQAKPAYGTGKKVIDFLIPSLIALTLFQGAVLGMGRSVAGEKREGSLTRVFLTPTSNTTIILGTLAFYVLFEMVRATFLIIISIILFNISIEGSYLLLALILFIYLTISTCIGLILSSMVRTEQQFQAMAMLVSLPTMFLAGAFFPVQAMPKFLQIIASFLPVTYAADALRGVMVKGFGLGMILYPILILLAFMAVAFIAAFAVFKRDIE